MVKDGERERERGRGRKSTGRRKLQTSVAKLGISPSKAQQKLAQGIGKVGRKRGMRRRMPANV